MKRQSLILGIASILLLTTCAGHLKHGVASVPGTASTIGASDRYPQPRTGADVSFEDIISWFAYELLCTATDSDDHGISAQVSNLEADQFLDHSGDSDGSTVDPDPYRLRARARFQAPALPRALAPRQADPANRSR